MSKLELNYQDWSDKIRFMMKTIQENDETDRTITVYIEIGTKLSWLIK